MVGSAGSARGGRQGGLAVHTHTHTRGVAGWRVKQASLNKAPALSSPLLVQLGQHGSAGIARQRIVQRFRKQGQLKGALVPATIEAWLRGQLE